KRFTATGCGEGPPTANVGCSNRSASPPPGGFMARSAISTISRSTATGRWTRTSSPTASMASRNSRRLSSATVQGADAAGQEFVAYVPEAGGFQTMGKGVGIGKIEHRLWQVGIGVRMFRHRATDQRQEPPEVEEVSRPQGREARGSELEDDEPGARF